VAVAGALVLVVMALTPLPVEASHATSSRVTFDFEGDALGGPPDGVSVTAGVMEVILDPLLGKALHPRSAGQVGTVPNDIKLAAATFDGVVGSDMSVTWREAAQLGGDRHAMTLRSSGKVSGYMFAVSNLVVDTRQGVSHNQVAVYRATDDNRIVELGKRELIGLPVRVFRAAALDRSTPGGTVTDLTLSYSDDGGDTFVPLLAVVDAAPLPPGGLQYAGGWEGTDATRTAIDDVDVTFDPRSALHITTPVDFQVFQRDAGGSASMTVAGTYRLPDGHAAPSAVEARWRGGPWTVIDSNPSAGRFAGALDGSAGQGTLEVRFANDTAVAASRLSVGVGDVFVVAGQSNAVGFGWEGQVYERPEAAPDLKASMLSPDLRWSELEDPVGGGGGSVWPLVATEVLADQGVPVAFVATAVGGTSIMQWQPGLWKYYGSMSDRINALGGPGSVRAVLFWQGETDAVNGMSRVEYRSRLEQFADSVWADFGVEVVAAQIGEVGVAGDLIDPIRQAQQEVWDAGGRVLRGPVLYDVDLSDDAFKGKVGDGTHFFSTADIRVAADRWWAALDTLFYGGADGRGPVLTSATRSPDGGEITVTFSDDTLPILPPTGADGFVVEDGTGVVEVSSATRTSPTDLLLDLAAPITGPATVSLGKGHASAGRAVPTDSTLTRFPADTFFDVPIGG
jgi:hypothetical protein